jgi:hypothetical protein
MIQTIKILPHVCIGLFLASLAFSLSNPYFLLLALLSALIFILFVNTMAGHNYLARIVRARMYKRLVKEVINGLESDGLNTMVLYPLTVWLHSKQPRDIYVNEGHRLFAGALLTKLDEVYDAWERITSLPSRVAKNQEQADIEDLQREQLRLKKQRQNQQ